MFKVNDYVVYSSTGVCRVIDIMKRKDIGCDETEYYVLQPVYNNNITIKTPVNNPRVMMRELIAKDAIEPLIKTLSEEETLWINDGKERNQKFKAVLRTGKIEELFKLVKMVHLERKEKSAVGKKLTKSDEDIMKTAEKHLHEEFAVALDISPEEVGPYILGHIASQTA